MRTIIGTITSVLIFVGVLHREDFFVSGQCTDTNNQCSGWANRGECTKNPLYMLQNCAKSCRVCSGCVNIYGDAYCTKYVGDCWHYNYWKTMVKNCKKTCVCTCCPTKPVMLPTTATLADTTTALNVSTADQTTAATTLYSTTTDERTTLASQITHSSFGTEANTSVPQTSTRTIYATEQDLSVTADPKGTNDVLLAAIIAAVVAFIGVLGLVMFWYWKRKRSVSLNQPKRQALPSVQNDCIPTEEIIWLERQPRRDSSKPLAVSLHTTAANESYNNQALSQDSPENPGTEKSIHRSPDTPFYHVLEEPDSSATSRERVLSAHYEQTSEHLRADSDYEALPEAHAAKGLPAKARENEVMYEVASTKGLCNVAPSNKNLDDNDEYCYSYTAVGQDLSVKDVENRPQEAPKTEDSNYHALEGPNTGYQAIERAPANGYTPMNGLTDLSGYQALKKPAKSVYQPLKKTNQPPRRAFTRK